MMEEFVSSWPSVVHRRSRSSGSRRFQRLQQGAQGQLFTNRTPSSSDSVGRLQSPSRPVTSSNSRLTGRYNTSYSEAWSIGSVLTAAQLRRRRTANHPDYNYSPVIDLPSKRQLHRQQQMTMNGLGIMEPPVDNSRKASNDIGNWIDKYQKSDHHVDRLVRTIVQYESATGQQFPGN